MLLLKRLDRERDGIDQPGAGRDLAVVVPADLAGHPDIRAALDILADFRDELDLGLVRLAHQAQHHLDRVFEPLGRLQQQRPEPVLIIPEVRPPLLVVDAAQRLAAAAHRPEQRLADLGVFRGLAATVMSGAGPVAAACRRHRRLRAGRRIGLEFFRGKPVGHGARSRLARTMSLKSVPGRSGISSATRRPASSQRRLQASAAIAPGVVGVVVGEQDQPLDAGDERELFQRAVRERGPGGPQRFVAIGSLVAAASIVSSPSPTTSCLPAGHSFTTPAVPSILRSIFWASGGQRDALDAGRRIADRVAHQREQAGMPDAGTEHAVRVEAQGIVDIVRQGVEIDAAGLRQIARRQRASDRLGGVPPAQDIGPVASPPARSPPARGPSPRIGRSPGRSSSSARPAPRCGRGPRPASASRCDRHRRGSRSSNSDRDRCAGSALFRRGSGQQILRFFGTGSSISSARSIVVASRTSNAGNAIEDCARRLVADIRAVAMGCRRCRRLGDSRGRGRWAGARRAGSGLSETSAAGLGAGLGAGADLGARAGLGVGAGAPVSSSQLCCGVAPIAAELEVDSHRHLELDGLLAEPRDHLALLAGRHVAKQLIMHLKRAA